MRIDLQDKRGIAECFEGVALVAAKHNPHTAAVLLGASKTLTETIGAILELYDYGIGLNIAPLKRELSQSPYDMDWDKGASMPLNEVFSYALDGV